MDAKSSRVLLIAVIVLLGAVSAPTAHPSAADAPPEPGDGSLLFIENVGQFDERARFQVRGGSATMWLAADGLWITLLERSNVEERHEMDEMLGSVSTSAPEPQQGVNLHVFFVDANPHPIIEPFNRLETKVSYLTGDSPERWQPDVPVWGGVRYADLYPGVDLEMIGSSGGWSWRLVLREPQSLSLIPDLKLRVEGAEGLALGDRCLRLSTVVGGLNLPLLSVTDADGQSLPRPLPQPVLNDPEISAPFTSPTPEKNPAATSAGENPGLVYATFLGGEAERQGNTVRMLQSMGRATPT